MYNAALYGVGNFWDCQVSDVTGNCQRIMVGIANICGVDPE